jgi:hypothetical protein
MKEEAIKVTKHFLEKIATWATRYDESYRSNPNFTEEMRDKCVPRRYRDPCAWDINCGWCEEWALTLQEKVQKGEVFWLDQIAVDSSRLPKPFVGNLGTIDICGYLENAPTHAVLFCDGRYYDSQHPDGVDDITKLDFVNFVSREDFLKRS